MNLTKCKGCNCQFNSVTGKSADKAILVYTLVGTGLAVIIVIVMAAMK
jgi:hypothetical protein